MSSPLYDILPVTFDIIIHLTASSANLIARALDLDPFLAGCPFGGKFIHLDSSNKCNKLVIEDLVRRPEA